MSIKRNHIINRTAVNSVFNALIEFNRFGDAGYNVIFEENRIDVYNNTKRYIIHAPSSTGKNSLINCKFKNNIINFLCEKGSIVDVFSLIGNENSNNEINYNEINNSPVLQSHYLVVTNFSVIPHEKYRSGTFANVPSNTPVGFKYFCTDRQTSEGATNGIEIIHKGNGVWVDALGRVIS